MSLAEPPAATSAVPVEALSTAAPRAGHRAARSQMLDACRAMAGMTIVWCHVATTFNSPDTDVSYLIGTFGVPFYLFVALFFVATGLVRDPSRSLGTYLLGRVKKLYLPFLTWTIAYAALTWIKNRHEPGQVFFSPHFLWAGSYTHLYFLPLLLTCTVVLALLIRPATRSAPLRWALSAVFLGAALAIGFRDVPEWLAAPGPKEDVMQALRNYLRAAPPALGAMAFALHFGRMGQRLVVPATVAAMGAIVTVACLIGQMIGKPTVLARAISGFGWTLFAFAPWRAEWLKPLAVIGRHSFGIYLAHVAFIRTADLIITRLDVPRDSIPMQLIVFAFSFVGAFILSACLARWSVTEWIVGYEGEKVRKSLAG